VTYTLPNVGPNQSSAINSISESGNVVTVTLASAIGQATVGGPIVISGVIPGGYDGNFTITSVSGTTIQYNDPISGLASASGGTATVPIPTFCSYQPDYVATSQTTAVYVANYGQENGTNCNVASTDSIAALSTTSSTISHIQYLGAGTHPIALLETPNAQNLYVVNQGNGTSATNVLNLSPVDLSTIATIPIGVNPSWIAMRANGQRVYVVTQGDGKLYSIDTASNTVVSTVSVGTGANFVLYDKNLDRLYVTNPAAGVLYVLSATTDPPSLIGGGPITIPPAPPCAGAGSGCGPVTPVSVAALPDGSRFYVASYQTQSPCSDPNVTSASCLIPMATILDANTLSVKNASSSIFAPALSLLTNPPFAGPPTNPVQYAVPELSSCVPPAVYAPGTTRFRIFASSATDGSHVYVSICDAGAIADIVTNTNTLNQGTNAADKLVIDLLAPFSAGAPSGVNLPPPPQSPLFLLTGQ
jgi:YVTN family beta-propeller protein